MTCSVRKPRGYRPTEISGTWDFKWPLGSEIRVAFQRPPGFSEEMFERARGEVIRLARRWEEAISRKLESSEEVNAADFFRNGIRLSFPDDLIFDSPPQYQNIVAEEHRSPFLVDERRRRYDVLVSLEDLPLNRHRASAATAGGAGRLEGEVEDVGIERVVSPTCELGCYARRRDFGIPTVYIGRFGQYGQSVDLDEYFTYPLVQHVVVHEFGHVLGLAHEHQNPHLDRTPFRPPHAIGETYAQIFQLAADHIRVRDVMEQVTEAWPGSTLFSDWNDFKGANKPTLYELDSVMTYPFHHLFLKPRLNPGVAVTGREIAEAIEKVRADLAKLMNPDARGTKPNGHPELYGLLTHPTNTDVKNLIRMYAPPRRPG